MRLTNRFIAEIHKVSLNLTKFGQSPGVEKKSEYFRLNIQMLEKMYTIILLIIPKRAKELSENYFTPTRDCF